MPEFLTNLGIASWGGFVYVLVSVLIVIFGIGGIAYFIWDSWKDR